MPALRLLVLLPLLLACPGRAHAQLGTPTRPNIVFIISDDHRWDALGVAGNEGIRTPTLDRLAAEGTWFRQATIFVSQCVPSRAVLLTGLAPHTSGIYSIPMQREDLWWQDSTGVATVPSMLRDAGYRTVLVGKWHLAADPWKSGFDDVRTWLPAGVAAYRDARLSVGRDRERRRVEGFTNEIFAADAAAFLSSAEARAAPFLLWLATTAPHSPMSPNPDSIVALYHGLDSEDLISPAFPRGARAEDFLHYSEAVTQVDVAVRRVLDALEANGLAGTTVVVFLGDNGYMMGSRGLSGKIVPYEESIRVPLIIRLPEQQVRGVSDAAVSSIDLPVTLLRMAGVGAPESWPGRDLLPLLRTGVDTGFEHAFAEWSDDQSWFGHYAHRLVRTPSLKLVRWQREGRGVELYDLVDDPHETTNVADDPAFAARRRELEARLDDWLERSDDPARLWPENGVPAPVAPTYPSADDARAREPHLTPEQLMPFVGSYETVQRGIHEIELREERLYFVGEGPATGELIALSDSEFLHAAPPAQLSPLTIAFERDGEGRVTRLIMRVGAFVRPARRVP